MTISDKHMADYRKVLPFTLIIVGFDALILVLYFLMRNIGYGDYIDILLIGGAGYSILFNIITWFAY